MWRATRRQWLHVHLSRNYGSMMPGLWHWRVWFVINLPLSTWACLAIQHCPALGRNDGCELLVVGYISRRHDAGSKVWTLPFSTLAALMAMKGLMAGPAPMAMSRLVPTAREVKSGSLFLGPPLPPHGHLWGRPLFRPVARLRGNHRSQGMAHGSCHLGL